MLPVELQLLALESTGFQPWLQVITVVSLPLAMPIHVDELKGTHSGEEMWLEHLLADWKEEPSILKL